MVSSSRKARSRGLSLRALTTPAHGRLVGGLRSRSIAPFLNDQIRLRKQPASRLRLCSIGVSGKPR